MVFKRREEPNPPESLAEQGLRRVADEVAASEAGQQVMTFMLRQIFMGLTPDQQPGFVLPILDRMPPAVRLALLAGVPVDEIPAMLAARERRPKIIQDILEHGRETGEVDLKVIPEGCQVDIRLYHARPWDRITDRDHLRSEDFFGLMSLLSMGDGRFSVLRPFAFNNPQYAKVGLEHGRQVELTSRTPNNQVSSTIAFGKAIWLQLGQTTATPIDEPRNHKSLVVGSVHIDDKPVFHKEDV